MRLKAVFSRGEDVAKDRHTRDHLALTTGNGNPMHEVCTGYFAHGSSKAKIRERSRHKNLSK